jgi:hypothetical protein
MEDIEDAGLFADLSKIPHAGAVADYGFGTCVVNKPDDRTHDFGMRRDRIFRPARFEKVGFDEYPLAGIHKLFHTAQ